MRLLFHSLGYLQDSAFATPTSASASASGTTHGFE
eukprot:gene53740-71823_t